MELEIFSLARDAVQNGPWFSLLDIFDQYPVSQFPAQINSFVIAGRLRFWAYENLKDPLHVEIHFIDEDGHDLVSPFVEKMQFPPQELEKVRSSYCMNLIMRMNKLPISKPGQYAVDLWVNGHVMRSLPLFVPQVKETGAS